MSTFATPLAMKVFALLSQNDEVLSAASIAQKLDVLTPTIYRSAEQLLSLGIIEKTAEYPVRYQLVSSEKAVSWFLLNQRAKFLQTFPPRHQELTTNTSKTTSINFIKNRASLLSRTDKDIASATQAVNFIVSGLEVPDSTVLVYRAAKLRGVKIRAIVQKRHKTSSERLEIWKTIGIEARYLPSTSLRLFIIDDKITYLTSFNQTEKEQAFGVRFFYPPLASTMHELFEEKWRAASPL